jgi:phosphoribosylformylglycinamidine synthase
VKARVFVTLKDGVLDPQGLAIQGALAALGFDGVAAVRQGKIFDIDLVDGKDSVRRLSAMCERLLANTIIEDYRVEVQGEP